LTSSFPFSFAEDFFGGMLSTVCDDFYFQLPRRKQPPTNKLKKKPEEPVDMCDVKSEKARNKDKKMKNLKRTFLS
jgi:hypothetical protein